MLKTGLTLSLQEMMGVLQDIELVLRSYANQPRPNNLSETMVENAA
jgi:hypothetical protein